MSKAQNKIATLVPATIKLNEGVIKTLENMMEVARSQGITGVAVIGVDAAGFTHTAYESGENIATLIGALERMKYRLLSEG